MTTPWSSTQLEQNHASRLVNSVLRWLPSALIMVAEGNRILHINDRARTLLHLEAAESRYKTLLDLPYYLNELKSLFLNDTPPEAQRAELTIKLPNDPTPRTLGYTIRQELLPDLGPVLTFVFSDITEVLYQAKIREQLKQEVSQAKRMSAMSTLIVELAAELNNPNIAASITQQLQGKTLAALKASLKNPSNEQTEFLGLLEQQLERLNRVNVRASNLLEELLKYARPPKMDLDYEEWDTFLSSLIKQWQRQWLDDHGVVLKVETCAPKLHVNIDRNQIKETLRALIKNALEAKVGQTPLELTISTRREPALEPGQPSRVVTDITDTGVGIPDEIFENIFDPCFTTKGEQVAGMGLSLAYQTLSRHNGALYAYSEAGNGSTFTLVLPEGEEPELFYQEPTLSNEE